MHFIPFQVAEKWTNFPHSLVPLSNTDHRVNRKAFVELAKVPETTLRPHLINRGNRLPNYIWHSLVCHCIAPERETVSRDQQDGSNFVMASVCGCVWIFSLYSTVFRCDALWSGECLCVCVMLPRCFICACIKFVSDMSPG